MASAYDTVHKYSVGEVDTEFVVHKFSSKLFVVVTQFGKINNIFTISSERSFENDLFAKYNKQLKIQGKFGNDTDEVQAALRRIFTEVDVKGLEIVVSLGLKEINRDILVEVTEILKEIVSRYS
ncbi:uncharacterized protein LOC132262247 [Phlebotomus argentipes]|uniref:uncharacterized protein LOC132262247 n=1 Tax=Phlebotomus argentipes TaxID=94469 RepID=UPI002893149E|nr:uncharacterized protein LOC132262247 [Phlebotomus argentipes]